MDNMIDVKKLIDRKISESGDIEYKEGWNSEELMHSICAFGNDIDSSDGGTILVGISAPQGVPEAVPGFDGSFDKAERELVRVCSLIQPRYIPKAFEGEYQDKRILIIDCPAGFGRPYRCPKKLGAKGKTDSILIHYIRKMSSTIEAKPEEVKELYGISRTIPFDDQMNPFSTIDDLSLDLIMDHLKESNSELLPLTSRMSLPEIARRMHLLDDGGSLHPRNVSLLFFAKNPETFFPDAIIEIVDARESLNKNIPVKTFNGPIQKQLVSALAFIEDRYNEQRLIKIDGLIKTKSIFAYPQIALKEILANAVYRRSYEIGEPITVSVTNSYIEVKSFPGFDRTIKEKEIKEGMIQSKRPYRNRRIGNFLKEIGLTEGRNTGIPTAEEALISNGSKPLLFLNDDERYCLRVRIYRQESFIGESRAPQNKKGTKEYRAEIISVLATGDYSLRSLSGILGLRSPSSAIRNAVTSLAKEGKIIVRGKGRSSTYHLVRK